MSGGPRYPGLVPELRALGDEAARLWGDVTERRLALEAVVTAWETGSADLSAAVARVDAAIVAGLGALGLPRGAVREVRVESTGRGWVGRKHADCSLVLDGEKMRNLIRMYDQPDTVFRTWVHESLHARQPFAVAAEREHRPFRGYEEGMVEGLARLVTRDRAGMRPLEFSYNYYVRAYRALALELAVDAEQLWRALWRHPTGRIRSEFAGAVDELWHTVAGRPLSPLQRSRLQLVADTSFRTDRSGDSPDERVLRTLWGSVFR